MAIRKDRIMKVRVPIVIKDPVTAKYYAMDRTEPYTIKNEDIFLDGPVSRRVAVLDFDAQTGQLLPGSRFKPPEKTGSLANIGYPINPISIPLSSSKSASSAPS